MKPRMSPLLLSVMMPAYNAEKYISRAVESVLAQTYPHWELLIVNDGSTDRTPDILAGLTDPRVKIFHQENGGESSARNTALQHMSGDYLAFLDSDDLYLPQHLQETVAYLESHPEYDGVYTDGIYIDENDQQLRTLSSRRRGPFEGDIFEEVVRSSDVFGPPLCVVLRGCVISKNNLEFDTNIVIGPDWDFFIKSSEVARFGYILQSTCLYRVHQTSISIKTNKQKRFNHLAKCRQNSVKMERFNNCSIETRFFVFYDLLVNLLNGLPDQQSDILKWSEFSNLSPIYQAKLLRLMASKAIILEVEGNYINDWMNASRKMNPKDFRGILVAAAYKLNPRICQRLLSAKISLEQDNKTADFILDELS